VDNEQQFYAYVLCMGDSVPGQSPCGVVGLTPGQYELQMNRPDSLWFCPHCGSTAQYDDARSEEAQGLNEEDNPLKTALERLVYTHGTDDIRKMLEVIEDEARHA